MGPRKLFQVASLVLVLALVMPALIGCGSTPTPTTVPTKAPVATTAPTAVPATKAPPTATVPATPTAAGPTVGDTLTLALAGEPDTLDVHKSGAGLMSQVMMHVGAALVARDPEDGKFVPWLADSWKVSDDGLVWTFTLKKGITFHDGTPLTAKDYAWTFTRALDPATKAMAASYMLGSVKTAEAPDDSTLVLNLNTPSFYLLLTLTSSSYMQPLSRAAVEKLGDSYGRAPVGVGPFEFKEWQTGSKIILERNPDFKWYPSFLTGGPYIQTIDIRFIVEDSTRLAGLESGELDFDAFQAKDYDRLKATGKLTVFQSIVQGCQAFVQFNVTKPPFDDIKVRQAMAYAVNRDPIIKAVALGQGVPQYGVLSPTMQGYWKGIEAVSPHFDVAKAKQLLADAGYTAGSDGIMQKGGQKLSFKIDTIPNDAYVKTATILAEQFKAIGIDMGINQVEQAIGLQNVFNGNYTISMFGFGYPSADVMNLAFTTTGDNFMKANDTELDAILAKTRSTVDPVKQQEYVQQAETRIIQQQYLIPTYAGMSYLGLNTRVKGAIFSETTLELWLIPAYLPAK